MMKQRHNIVQKSFFLLLITLLLAAPFVAAQTVQDLNLGYVNYPDPKILVNFSEPATIITQATTLVRNQTTISETLTYTPAANEPSTTRTITPNNNLALGSWLLSVTASGFLGTPSSPETILFRITGLNIELTNPPNGFSPNTPYNVRFKTHILAGSDLSQEQPFNAECKYFLGTFNQPFDDPLWQRATPSQRITDDPNQYFANTNLGSVHTINNLQTPSTTLSIICRQYKLSGTAISPDTRKQFQIGHISTNPEITITASPEVVTNSNNPRVLITATTNQESYCTITREGTTHPLIIGSSSQDFTQTHQRYIYYNNNEGLNEHIQTGDYQELDYLISCENRASRTSTKDLTVALHLQAPLTILVDTPTNPTKENPVVLDLRTNRQASCSACLTPSSCNEMTNTQGNRHTTNLQTTNFANHSVNITCTSTDGAREHSLIYNFTVDRIPPTNVNIDTQEVVCNAQVSAHITAQDNHELSHFTWRLLDASQNQITNGTSNSGLVNVTIPQNTQQITWEATAHDKAGNTATANPTTIPVRPGNSDECSPGPFIQYHEPPMGYSTSPFSPTIKTKRPATCGYLVNLPGVGPDSNHNPLSSSNDGQVHQLPVITQPTRELHILCEEPDETIHARVMDFGIFSEQLIITNLQAEPNPLFDFQNLNVSVYATTNLDAVCSLKRTTTKYFDGENLDLADTYKKEHTRNLDVSSIITTPTNVELAYVVTCKDRAGRTATKQLPIVADFSNTNIDVLSPKQYTNNQQPPIIIRPQTPSVCYSREPNTLANAPFTQMSVQPDGTHQADMSVTLEQGAHTVVVKCENTLGVESQKTIVFSVDTIAPAISFEANDVVCKDSTSAVFIDVVDESPTNTLLTISDVTNTTQQNISQGRYVVHSANHPLGELTIQAQATDEAGNEGTAQTHTISILPAGDPACSEINVSECPSMPQCPSGQRAVINSTQNNCPEYVCEEDTTTPSPPTPPPTGCTSNSDCSSDQVCRAGNCVFEDRPDDVFDEEQGFPWLALILIILGTVLVGGSGYYLYFEYNERQTMTQRRAMSSQGGFAQRPQGLNNSGASQALSPEQQAKIREQLAARKQAQEQARQEHLHEREEKRHAVAAAFDDKTNNSQKPSSNEERPFTKEPMKDMPVQPATNEQPPSLKDAKNTSSNDDEYVLLGEEQEIDHKKVSGRADSLTDAKQAAKENTSSKEEKKKSVFEDLDKLIDEEK